MQTVEPVSSSISVGLDSFSDLSTMPDDFSLFLTTIRRHLHQMQLLVCRGGIESQVEMVDDAAIGHALCPGQPVCRALEQALDEAVHRGIQPGRGDCVVDDAEAGQVRGAKLSSEQQVLFGQGRRHE